MNRKGRGIKLPGSAPSYRPRIDENQKLPHSGQPASMPQMVSRTSRI